LRRRNPPQKEVPDLLVLDRLDHLVCNAGHRVARKSCRHLFAGNVFGEARKAEGLLYGRAEVLTLDVGYAWPAHHSTGEDVVSVRIKRLLYAVGSHDQILQRSGRHH
jgi:hypothetical protein